MALGKKTGGRKKGTPNKNSITVKESLKNVYERMGGDDAMLAWAQENPDEFYRHWIKMLPTEVKNDITSNGETIMHPVTIELVGVDPDE